MQSKLFSANKTLNIRGRLIDLSEPRVMGILNVTPDSFYSGSRFTDETAALRQAEKMLGEGADFIDVGGYSTRPGAAMVTVEEELARVLPAIKAIEKEFPQVTIAIDTFRAIVAKQACDCGASLINDVSAGALDQEMFITIASLNVPCVMMHMRGTPQTMNDHTNYDNLLASIIEYFHQKIAALHELGVKDIIIDPGFGFAKTVTQNFELLHKLDELHILGMPILAGLSRKSMIWRNLNTTPEGALNGTTALNTIALTKGSAILRVHDVREARETIQLLKLLNP